MHIRLLSSLLDLAHATSENLAFAHRSGVDVSYGEETITETNLLELRRRHPGEIMLRTFSRIAEAKNGADWEWHIIGRARTFGMRVQAKRLQKDDKLKIKHTVRSSGKDQIDLLIESAKKYRLMPVYCLYSSEKQRSKWKAGSSGGIGTPFEYGCLLANAHAVRVAMPKSLDAIEDYCVPWHFLVDQRRFHRTTAAASIDGYMRFEFLNSSDIHPMPIAEAIRLEEKYFPAFPTIHDLNDPESGFRGREGFFEASDGVLRDVQSEEAFRERGISRLLQIDVRDLPGRKGSEDDTSCA